MGAVGCTLRIGPTPQNSWWRCWRWRTRVDASVRTPDKGLTPDKYLALRRATVPILHPITVGTSKRAVDRDGVRRRRRGERSWTVHAGEACQQAIAHKTAIGGRRIFGAIECSRISGLISG
jgi:hypothetical protein